MDTDNTKEINQESNLGMLFLNIILFGLVVVLIFVVSSTYKKNIATKNLNNNVENLPKEDLSMPPILAKSAIVLDVINGNILFEKNSKNILPLASLTKVVTVFTAKELANQNIIVSINKEFLGEEGDNGLLVDEKWNLKNLADYSLLVSSNDASRSIASVVGAVVSQSDIYSGRDFFIRKMNSLVKDLGFTTLNFTNETGLDNGNIIGGKGSAEEFAKLISYIIIKHPDLLEATKFLSQNISSKDFIHKASNTNEVVGQIPNILASKTGFTDKAGGNLMVAFDAGINRPIVVVVMGSTLNGRFEDVLKLASSSMAILK